MAEKVFRTLEPTVLIEYLKAGKVRSKKPPKSNDYGGTRLPFEVVFPDGKVGPIILQLDKTFSFGVSQNLAKNKDGSEEASGYSMCLTLTDKEPTQKQLDTVAAFKLLYEFGQKAAVERKVDINKPSLNMKNASGLVKNPLYWTYIDGKQDEEGNQVVDETKSPKLYVKLETAWEPVKVDSETGEPTEEIKTIMKTFTRKTKDKKTGKEVETKELKKMVITSEIWNTEGVDIDPLSMLDKHCNVKGAIGIEGLYVGPALSFQVKLYQGEVSFYASRKEATLMKRPTAASGAVGTTPATTGVKVIVGGEKKTPAQDPGVGSSTGAVSSTETKSDPEPDAESSPASEEEEVDDDALLDE